MAIWDKINNFAEKVSDTIGESSEKDSAKSIHDEFTPAVGVPGKHTVFTESALIYGSDQYSYSELNPIKLLNIPTTALLQGTAQAVTENGKIITIAFAFQQKDRFIRAVNYANEQINLAHGATNNYKFLLQSVEGSKLEIYEDYAQMHYLASGFKNLLNNTMKSGATITTMYFADMTIQFTGITADNKCQVAIQYKGESYSLLLNAAEQNTVQEAVAYISSVKESGTMAMQEPEHLHETWKPESGTVRTFSLEGKVLEVPENLDVFNNYRLKFRQLASECADCARAEFNKKVHDLPTYLDMFPCIYGYYMAAMVDKAMEIVVAENIWTVTKDSFMKDHTNNFHLASDDLSVTIKSVGLTIQANQRSVSNAMSFVPNLIGGGFGIKGAAKGIATATAFNVARDSTEAALVKSAANINQAQQIELYNRVNHDILFQHVFLDYWRVFLTLVAVLRKNGKDIWWPSNESTQQAQNIFQNLSSPAFPQDKLLEVFLNILKTNPYNAAYHKFLLSRFGKTEEAIAIKNYYGYTNFNDPRIG